MFASVSGAASGRLVSQISRCSGSSVFSTNFATLSGEKGCIPHFLNPFVAFSTPAALLNEV